MYVYCKLACYVYVVLLQTCDKIVTCHAALCARLVTQRVGGLLATRVSAVEVWGWEQFPYQNYNLATGLLQAADKVVMSGCSNLVTCLLQPCN